MPLGENQCTEVRAPFGLSITTSVITSLLTIITAPGNLLICIVILKDPNKELRTAFNYLLINVAISDLLVGAITDPIFVFFHIREALGHPVMSWYVLPHMSFFIGCTSSLLSIAMLAVERAIAVNASYHRKLPRKRAIKMSVAIWIFSITFPCIYFQCGYFRFAFIFSIPMIIFIFITIMTSFLKIHDVIVKTSSQVCPNGSMVTNEWKKRIESERRITRVFKIILVFYAICNVPACVLIFIVNLCENCSCLLVHWSRDFLLLFILINCAGNQFIYAWKNRCFVRAVRSLNCQLVPLCPRKNYVVQADQKIRPKFVNKVDEIAL